MKISQVIRSSRTCVILTGAASLLSLALAADQDQQSAQKDLAQLVSLSKPFLCDPRGLTRVRVPFVARTVWGKQITIQREGWLKPQRPGHAAWVVFSDGESIVAPEHVELLDFNAEMRKLLERLQPATVEATVDTEVSDPDAPPDEIDGRQWAKERELQTASAPYDENLTTLAIWLHQRGERQGAA